jgi:pSer/pThr/pTyr-binding forkhead associated (FHA) protein
MSDPCLQSSHLGVLPRRERFRSTRQVLLEARGDLTMTWPRLARARRDLIDLGTEYLLAEPMTGRIHPLRVGLNRIGRLPDNDIIFEELTVSRRHCVILVHARGWCELHDTASLNGTSLNGLQIREPAHLQDGDCIAVCRRLLIFKRAEDAPAAPEAATLGTMID